MPHFFIKSENLKDNIITIEDKENYNHMAKSLRAKRGEKILLIDENQIQYETVIKNITPNKIECFVEKSYKSERDLKFDLFLAYILPLKPYLCKVPYNVLYDNLNKLLL